MIPAHWFNPDLNYETYMAPGILVLLVTMIGTFLSAMNVVREKEIGTIESMPVDFFLLRLCQRRSTVHVARPASLAVHRDVYAA